MRELFEKVIRNVTGRTLVPDREETARLGREVVRLYEQGRYSEAEEAANRLVESERATLGDDQPGFAAAISNLGLLRQKQGKLSEAESLLREALEIRGRVLGVKHPLYAASLSHLAELLQLQNDLESAEPLLRQALEIRKEALGVNHPDYASGLTGLALFMNRRGDYAGAEPLLRQVLEIRRQILGERHPQTASAISNLALLLQRKGDLESAEALFRQAIDVRSDVLGDDHPDHAASLSHLARLFAERQEWEAAEPLLLRAVALRTEALGESHPDVIADFGTLVMVREAREKAKPARQPRGADAADLSGPLSAPESLGSRSAEIGDSQELAAEASALAEEFARIGPALVDAGQTMSSIGRPADMSLLEQAIACQRRFAALEIAASLRAEMLGLESVAAGTLPALSSLLDRVAVAETGRRAREQALSLLDRVLALRHRDPSEAGLLSPCHDLASALRSEISEADSSAMPPVAFQVASGEHTLSSLLGLIDSDKDVGDDEWLRMYRTVGSTFGQALAAAAARKRLEPAIKIHAAPAASSARKPPNAASPTLGQASRLALGGTGRVQVSSPIVPHIDEDPLMQFRPLWPR